MTVTPWAPYPVTAYANCNCSRAAPTDSRTSRRPSRLIRYAPASSRASTRQRSRFAYRRPSSSTPLTPVATMSPSLIVSEAHSPRGAVAIVSPVTTPTVRSRSAISPFSCSTSALVPAITNPVPA